MQVQSTFYRLGYLGLIPFIFGVYLVVANLNLMGHPGMFWFCSYSAIILSFLGGALWGRAIQIEAEGTSAKLLIMSNVVAIIAWGCLLLGNLQTAALALLTIGFAALLIVEYFGDQKVFTDVDKGYVKMRVNLTSLVIIAHLIVLPYSTGA
jgi:hypothetical protein